MASFESVFGIPADHTLKMVEVRNRAGDDSWKHEEYDASGKLLARYESWHNLSIGKARAASGWRKLSPTGRLLAEEDNLRI